MRPKAHIQHQLPHRLRLQVPSRKRDDPFFKNIASRIEQLGHVKRVRVNSLIGSLVIEHTDHSSDGLLEKLRDSELLDLTGPETTDAADPLNNVPFLKANPVSDNLKSVQGRWREPLTLLLLSLAIYQIVRGDIMAPALPLLWYALELIVKKDPGL